MTAPAPPPLIDAELQQRAERHAQLICVLERLADLGGDEPLDARIGRGDHVAIGLGDVVLARLHRRWRYGVAVDLDLDGTTAQVTVAYLSPTALDNAQNSWAGLSRRVLDPRYPLDVIPDARDAYSDATAAALAARAAFEGAVMLQAAATSCHRRPWAAAVPVQRARRPSREVFRSDDSPSWAPLPALG